MFSPALGRVFRSASSATAAPANPLGRAALSTAQQPFRPHQRRLSSSKPSVPADNSKRPTENATEELKAGEKKARRNSKLRGSSSASSATVATRNIPFVPPTNHLTEPDLKLSTLFSQHRPMSIGHSVPETHSMTEFEALFKPQPRNESQIIMETHQTLNEFIQRFSNEAEGYEAYDALEEAGEVIYHLDGLRPSHESLEHFMSQFQPFVPPPAPAPYDPQATESQVTPGREMTLPTTHTGRSEAFREHVTRRRSGMLLISVKRQRKLKMKKHKYKKLMKRTRLLRRKLDRL